MIPFFKTGLYTGPIAEALGKADISMLIGLPVSAAAYLWLCRGLDLLSEMEQIASAHLRRLGAYLEPRFATVPPSHSAFPVHASVVIPVRNRVETITDAVRSALAQHGRYCQMFPASTRSNSGP